MPSISLSGNYGTKQVRSGLSIPAYDYIDITYNGNNDPATVNYLTGGASGRIVASLTLSYDGSFNLTSVDRTV